MLDYYALNVHSLRYKLTHTHTYIQYTLPKSLREEAVKPTLDHLFFLLYSIYPKQLLEYVRCVDSNVRAYLVPLFTRVRLHPLLADPSDDPDATHNTLLHDAALLIAEDKDIEEESTLFTRLRAFSVDSLTHDASHAVQYNAPHHDPSSAYQLTSATSHQPSPLTHSTFSRKTSALESDALSAPASKLGMATAPMHIQRADQSLWKPVIQAKVNTALDESFGMGILSSPPKQHKPIDRPAAAESEANTPVGDVINPPIGISTTIHGSTVHGNTILTKPNLADDRDKQRDPTPPINPRLCMLLMIRSALVY